MGEDPNEFPQHSVSHLVSVIIVDFLEMVCVDHQQGKRRPMSAREIGIESPKWASVVSS